MNSTGVPTAHDLMVPHAVQLKPGDSIYDAVKACTKHRVSGAIVVDEGELVGFLSEKDCLKLLSSRTFHGTPAAHVSDYMTRDVLTIGPETDIYTIAGIFLRNVFRRLPVVEDGRILGEVSRREVLMGMERMRLDEDSPNSYPDYRRPVFGSPRGA